MNIPLYAASVPVFRQLLESLQHVLSRAESYAASKKLEPRALLDARLFPDMFPFLRQIQIACDFAKGACARLAGVDVPKYENVEDDFSSLGARVARTLAFIDGLEPDRINDGAQRLIVLKKGEDGFDQAGPAKENEDGVLVSTPMRGDVYLLRFAIPQFFFHVITAYGILRHHGVDLGKKDYLGNFGSE